MATNSSSQMRFLFLQLLLLSATCLSVESTSSREDLPPISTLHLRASSNSAHDEINPTNSTDEERQLRTDKRKESPITTEDLYRTPIPIPTNSSSSDSKTNNNNMFRIVGGTNHEGSGMPNFAMLLSRSRNEYFSSGCSGSLISPCHILTAAHCVDDPSKLAGMGVYVNAYRPWGDNNGLSSHFTTVAAYAIHPSYTNYGGSRPIHDVAILTLAKCVDENENKDLFLHNIMELATLDDWNRLYHGTSLRVSGFGSTVVTGIGGHSSEMSDTLRTVQVPFQSQCSRQGFYTYGLVQDNDMMCAGDSYKDACFGDSGGPLYLEYSSRTSTQHPRRKQFGVVSWGHGCGLTNKPGVYASVAHHYDYIRRIVCSNPNVQMSDWGVTGTSYNMCGTRKSVASPPTGRPTKPPTPKPVPRPTLVPTVRPTSSPTPKPTRTPTSAPTPTPGSYVFDNGLTAERKERSSENDKVAQKLSGGSYVSTMTRIRGGSANNKRYGGTRRRTRQLGSLKEPEEAV